MDDLVAGDERVLVGCALPPKVAGVPRGAVLLSVPHVLPSATTDAAAERSRGSRGSASANASAHRNEDGSDAIVPRLPMAPLVRMRWWGEDRPGSTLFRPTRITHEREDERTDVADAANAQDQDEEEDDEVDRGDSSIRMRYPVCVPLEQLLDYLHDMKDLVFDVVDRASRKKIGRSVFPLQFDGGATGAEDAAAKLRRVNALCEIHSTVDAAVVLGYLAVNFEIEWPAMAEVSTPLKWANAAGMAPAVSVNPKQTLGIVERDTELKVQQRLSFSSISSSSTLSGVQRQAPWRRAAEESSATAPRQLMTQYGQLMDETGRLEDLLEKGRALERSMSKAVTEEAVVSTPIHPIVDTAQTASSPVSMMMLMAPYEAMTQEVDNSWESVLEEAEKIQAPTQSGRAAVQDAVNSTHHQLDGVGVSLGGHNALEISFESMELEQGMMDRLRQLREGSVSTRFSPIQLVVSHEHPRRMLKQTNGNENDHWIAAFAVNSSLRKRNWRTNYTHTLPLLASRPHRPSGGGQNVQANQRVLKFRVRCKPQHASPTGTRRRGRQTQTLDLTAEVPVEELLDHRDRPWVLSLPLRILHEVSGPMQGRSFAKRSTPVGTITVKFRFCALPDVPEDGNDQMSEDAASSAWSRDEEDRDRLTGHDDSRQANAIHPLAPDVNDPRSRLRWIADQSEPRATRTPLFFGLLIGRTVLRKDIEANSRNPDVGRQVASRFSIRIDYGTPSFFGRSAKSLQLKRSAKASLRFVDERLKANMRHMTAFPVDVSDEFVQKLAHGLLIFEVWIEERSVALKSYTTEKLIGVVKVPLHPFVACTRDNDAIRGCLTHAIPHIGVDQDFRIVDPLHDQVNGEVHMRVAFGSAEQMFNIESSLAAVVKLQALTRGWLTRRSIAYWKRFELARFDDEHQELHADAHPSEEQIIEEVEHESAGSPSTIAAHGEPDMSYHSAVREHTINHRVIRIEIRVEVRQSYAKAAQVVTPIIGCEVYGHLRFNDGVDEQSTPRAGPRFTLWWDANEVHLNSHFIHTLQASSLSTGIQLRDVLLLFRIELQSSAAVKSAQENRLSHFKGGAGIDLASVITDEWGVRSGTDQVPNDLEFLEDVDLPIEWGIANGETKLEGLAESLPLRIGMRITRANSQDDASLGVNTVVEEDGSSLSDVQTEEVTAIQTVSRTERLLPATLHLSLDIQRISDLRDMIQELLNAAARRSDAQNTVRRLKRTMDSGALTLKIIMSLCLGVELHPEEANNSGDDAVFQDSHNRWYKQFRYEHIKLDLVNDVQAFPSITQGDVHVVVHPELIAFFQEGSLDMQLLVCDDEGDVPAGIVSVPVSAILFRPSGVQGSFPVRVHDVLAGRVGVHLCIEHDEISNRSLSSESVSTVPDGNQRVEHQPASQSLSSVVVEDRGSERPQDQTMEQAIASIHEAAQQIQDRLARLTAQSTQSQINTQPIDQLSAISSPDESTDGTSLKLLASPMFTSNPSNTNEHPQAKYPGAGEDNEEIAEVYIQSDHIQHAGTNESSESGSVVLSDAHVDFDAFKPITLESFGIDEIEPSPIYEVNSPTLEDIKDIIERSADSAMEGSTVIPQADELSEAGTDLSHDRVQDDISSDIAEKLECLSAESEVNSVCDVEVDSDADRSSIDEEVSVTECLRQDVEQHNTGNEQLDIAPNKDDIVAVDSLVENDDAGDISQGQPASKSSLVDGIVAKDPHNPAVEGDHDDSANGNLTNHGNDAIKAEVDVTEHNDEFPSSADTNADESQDGTRQIQVEHHVIEDSNITEDNTDCDECVVEAAPDDCLHPQQSSLALCDSSTQTQGDDEPESATLFSHEPPTSPSEVSDIPPVTVDSSCQTEPDTDEVPRSDAARVTSQSNEHVDDMDTQTSSASTDFQVHHVMDESTIVHDPVSDVRQVLPAKKFEIAWQLLNEIRALYVDPNAVNPLTPPPTSVEETDMTALTTQDLVTSRGTLPVTTTQRTTGRSDSTASADLHEQAPDKRGAEGDEHDRGGVIGSESVSTHVSAVTWHWRDADNLKAEVEERLRGSKREYDEALALSQSMHSIKSWSSSSQFSTKRVMTAEWEEKAQELSASALAKRQHDARTQALFRVDSETERIARIMQGSVRYWLHEDDDDDGDGTSEDGAELADNYF